MIQYILMLASVIEDYQQLSKIIGVHITIDVIVIYTYHDIIYLILLKN